MRRRGWRWKGVEGESKGVGEKMRTEGKRGKKEKYSGERDYGMKDEERREAVEELLKEIGAEVRVEQVRKLKGFTERGTEMVWARYGSEKQRKEVMELKRKLSGKKERIMEDLTWGERRMRWKPEEIAKKEERRGNKTWIGYGKIGINK